MTPEDIKRWIWNRCTRCGKCLMWDGAVDDGGVPQLRLPGSKKVEPARRVLLKAMGKDIEGKLATTICGNQLCMDEKHAVAWSRKRLQRRSAKATNYGQNAARRLAITKKRRATAILDMEKVRQMRADGLTSREAAQRYGVTQSTAAKALSGETWKEYASPFSGLILQRNQ